MRTRISILVAATLPAALLSAHCSIRDVTLKEDCADTEEGCAGMAGAHAGAAGQAGGSSGGTESSAGGSAETSSGGLTGSSSGLASGGALGEDGPTGGAAGDMGDGGSSETGTAGIAVGGEGGDGGQTAEGGSNGGAMEAGAAGERSGGTAGSAAGSTSGGTPSTGASAGTGSAGETSAGGTATGGWSSGGMGAGAASGASGAAGAPSTIACESGYVLQNDVCTSLVASLVVVGAPLGTAFDPDVATYAASVDAASTTVEVTSEIDGVEITIAGTVGSRAAVELIEAVTTVAVTASAHGESAEYAIAITRLGAQQAYVKASNTQAADYFGARRGVALSADGNTLAIAAETEDGGSEDQSSAGLENSGSVYVFARSNQIWSQQAYLKAPTPTEGAKFGSTVVLGADGNTLIVGALGEAEAGFETAGAVYVFTREGDSWNTQERLTALNPQAHGQYGREISISADGTTLAVGAEGDDNNLSGPINETPTFNDELSASGAVYLYFRGSSGWNFQGYLKAPNAGEHQYFGSAVSLSENGNRIVVGAWYESGSVPGVVTAPDAIPAGDGTADQSGAAYVFSRVGVTWSWDAYLKAPNLSVDDFFGSAAAISADGTRIVVGAFGESSSSVENADLDDVSWSGAAHVFMLDAGVWYESAMLKSPAPTENGCFGASLVMSADGSVLAVGADGEASELADGTAVSAGGAAYRFSNDAVAWGQPFRLLASNPDPDDAFGRALGLSGDGRTLVVGAPNEDSAGTGVNNEFQLNNSAVDSGAAYVFVY